MDLKELRTLRKGDWIEHINGDVGMIHHFVCRGKNKPFIKVGRSAPCLTYVRVLPQGVCWHHDVIRRSLPGLEARTLRKVVEKMEMLERLAKEVCDE